MKVVVVGSANMDLVFRTERFPGAGETILGKSFATFPGGKGANQAVAAARLGADVSFVGKVGRDAFGDELRASLHADGVNVCRLLRSEESPTGVAGILVNSEGQNCIVAANGANGLVMPEDVTSGIAGASVALAQLEIPLASVQAISGVHPFILNPAPACEIPDELVATADILTPNETETLCLTGVLPVDDASCLDAASKLFNRGAKAVLITLGSRGSFYAAPQGGRHFPTIEVQAIDTTAAGDAFNGALATFLAEGRDIENAILLANCVGALCATKEGAQASMPTREELRQVADKLF